MLLMINAVAPNSVHSAVINDIGTIDVGIWIAGQWTETKEKIPVRNK